MVDEYDLRKNKIFIFQLYDIQDRQKLAVHYIEQVLCGERLRRKKTAEIWKVLSARQKFGLIPVGSIKELVHIVAKDSCSLKVDDGLTWKKAYQNLAKETCGLKTEQIYVNSIYVPIVVNLDENEIVL